MSVEILMPKSGLTNTEGTIDKWHASEGDTVKKGDFILEIENEKTTIDFESPADGILHITALEGDEVVVGGVMGYLAESSAEYDALCSSNNIPSENELSIETSKSGSTDTVAVESKVVTQHGIRKSSTPLARAVANKAGIDISLITGTGPGGRIVCKDVELYINLKKDLPVIMRNREPIRTPLAATRKVIAKRMYESLQSMAQTSDSVEIDITDLVVMRNKLKSREGELGIIITINDLLSRAAVKVIAKHPLANSELAGDELITYPYINLSMAVATDYGLKSPVIKDADELTFIEFCKALRSVVVKARENKLTIDDLTGGTFTLTNMGVFPVDNFNPIINPPQSAIIGFGRAIEKPWIFDGVICPRTTMVLSITYDHRVFDGSEVGSIMRDMKDYLENPEMILL